jgi:hypothetical protein
MFNSLSRREGNSGGFVFGFNLSLLFYSTEQLLLNRWRNMTKQGQIRYTQLYFVNCRRTTCNSVFQQRRHLVLTSNAL